MIICLRLEHKKRVLLDYHTQGKKEKSVVEGVCVTGSDIVKYSKNESHAGNSLQKFKEKSSSFTSQRTEIIKKEEKGGEKVNKVPKVKEKKGKSTCSLLTQLRKTYQHVAYAALKPCVKYNILVSYKQDERKKLHSCTSVRISAVYMCVGIKSLCIFS